ncbi:hypothetical protein D3C80_1683800 [compost metagenome]
MTVMLGSIAMACSNASLSGLLGMFQPKAGRLISEERNCTVGARSNLSVPSIICMMDRAAEDGSIFFHRPNRSRKRMD